MSIRAPLFAVITLAIAVGTALAVKPGQWVQDTEADFGPASLEQTVVTNLGRIELSRASEKLASLSDAATIIYDMAADSTGTTYLAIGPTGELATLDKDNKVQSLAKYPDQQVFALAADGAALWVGISGEHCELEKREAGKVTQTIEVPDIRYIWDIVIDDGKLALATGTDGKVLIVDPAKPEEKPVVALKCDQNNVLCLGIDAQKRLYAGTDTEGLVYRLTPAPEEEEHPYSAYVLYDATEPEIGAMVVMPDGTVYAGTADANQAKPGRLNEASKEEQGKPAPKSDEGEQQPGVKPNPPKPLPEPPENPKPLPVPPEPTPTPGDKAAEPHTDAPADPGQAQPKPMAAQTTAKVQPVAEEHAAEEPAAADDKPHTPSKAQYEQLRKLIGKRLAEARKSGSITAKSGSSKNGLGSRRADSSASSGGKAKSGNAVYCITPDGFVSEVFRESVMILRMAMVHGELIIATGNEGQIYRIDPTRQEVTVLADLESQQVPAMLVKGDDETLIGTANPATVARLGSGYAHTGTFTADPLDASQISHWGQLQIVADLPEHTEIKVSTRSGNVSDPDQGFWSEWSDPQPVTIASEGQPFFMEVASPSARFIQYMLIMDSDGSGTPSISKVALKYLMPNLSPRIASLAAKYPALQIKPDAAATPRNVMNVEWEASDPNSDTLNYTLAARRLGSDQPFVTVATDLRDTSYAWNTLAMPDGRYELRITADDSPDNVPDQVKTAQRLSAPVVIDNTAPAIEKLAAKPVAAGKAPAGSVLLTAEITDKMSIISDIRYSVSSQAKADAQPTWNAVLPVDQIDDSTNERVSFTIPPLSPGVRVLTLRATDAQGNTAYQSVTVTIPQP